MSNFSYDRYNRKRKNYEDSNYDDYKKKRLHSDSISNLVAEDELEATIYRVGERPDNPHAPFSIEASIESTSTLVLNQILDKRDEAISVLIECATKLPEKLSVYGTLIGLINIRNPTFVEDFINSLTSSLKENLKCGHFFIVHRLIRFVSNLVNVRVLSTQSVLDIYKKFAEITDETSSPQVRTDFYIYCVLSSIPWNGKILYEKHGPDFDEILEKIKKYIGHRQKDYLPLIKVWSNDDPHPQEEYLDCIWAQIKKLEENDWKESQIVRTYIPFESVLANSKPHEFPVLVPPEDFEQAIYPLPRCIFRMFDYTDVPEEYILPGAHAIERFLIEEQLHSTINTYYLERKLCASKLLQLNVSNKIPLNYMIVEVIFGQLFTLPKSPLLELFYGSLLIELCKLQPHFMPQVLAQATELIYERIDSMKTSCIERFSSWFAYHLSNFQYKWSWEDWKACLDEDFESPRNRFLRETLVRCMRLSYHQRIIDIIPESMSKLIPSVPKPTYRYESEEAANLEGTGVANKLLELFKERSIPEDVFQVLRDIPDKYNDQENQFEEFNPLKIEVFTSTLLYFGSKSFSHAFAALAKYHMIFKMLVDTEQSQLVVLSALHDVWKNHQQMMVVMVDKMLKTQIVECSSVANWIFSDSMKSDLNCFYVWEILHASVNRMSKQVSKLQHEYNQLNEKINKSSLDNELLNEASEEELEHKLQTLNSLKEQQKKLFFIIIKHFIKVLSEHLNKPDIKIEEGEKADVNPHWFKSTSERFEDILLTHNEEILPYLNELKEQLFVTDSPKYLLKLYKMFASFKK